MTGRRLLVVGAGGDVGRGIVGAALQAGRCVVAAGRRKAPLTELAALGEAERLAMVQGDLSEEGEASALWDEAVKPFGGIDEVVVSVNVASAPRPLADLSLEALRQSIQGNLLTHFAAARAFLPRMPAGGTFLGIGGGTADFILPGMAPVSMAQAALRMMYRGFAKERKGGPRIHELMIVSMVAGRSNRADARPDWVTDEEVGRHVCAILDDPIRFAKPVLHLRSRAQVGQPEADA